MNATMPRGERTPGDNRRTAPGWRIRWSLAGSPPHGAYRALVTSISLALLLCAPLCLSSATLGPLVSRPASYALRLDGVASWYHLPGQIRADGQPYGGMTVAHRTLPLGSVRTLCRQDRPLVCVRVVVADRGPNVEGRDWDLSRQAARRLGMIRRGVCDVTVK